MLSDEQVAEIRDGVASGERNGHRLEKWARLLLADVERFRREASGTGASAPTCSTTRGR
jgi:hypothetical protein